MLKAVTIRVQTTLMFLAPEGHIQNICVDERAVTEPKRCLFSKNIQNQCIHAQTVIVCVSRVYGYQCIYVQTTTSGEPMRLVKPYILSQVQPYSNLNNVGLLRAYRVQCVVGDVACYGD